MEEVRTGSIINSWIMKKTAAILLGLLSLIACTNEYYDINLHADEKQETGGIKVNLEITRSDVINSKASVKTLFSNNDVVFIFFKGITAPKYLEMKYNSSRMDWTPTAKNELSVSDLNNAVNKKMTAIYLPYGSGATIVADDGSFLFQDDLGNPLNYKGYYLQVELADYSIDEGTLSGSLPLSGPSLVSAEDRLIHFDISGFTSGNKYDLYQEYVKPLLFRGVSSDGIISSTVLSAGAAITGYQDGSMMSFSGILDARAVGSAVDYSFSINDWTDYILYTRDANTKIVSDNKYIGIGDISTSTWTKDIHGGFIDLGLSVKWAPYNVGASAPEGYGDYYAWAEIDTYYEAGYAEENPQTHWKEGKTTGYSSWVSYKYCNGTYATFTKYCTKSGMGYESFTDGKTALDPDDDVAHVLWGGNWRMPTSEECAEFVANCTWRWTTLNGVNGFEGRSKVSGYESRSIFLPAAGTRIYTLLEWVGTRGYYRSCNIDNNSPSSQFGFCFIDEYGVYSYYGERLYGNSVRPVCP